MHTWLISYPARSSTRWPFQHVARRGTITSRVTQYRWEVGYGIRQPEGRRGRCSGDGQQSVSWEPPHHRSCSDMYHSPLRLRPLPVRRGDAHRLVGYLVGPTVAVLQLLQPWSYSVDWRALAMGDSILALEQGFQWPRLSGSQFGLSRKFLQG